MSRWIAIVEDDPSIRENYADALRKQGYQVAALCRSQRGAARFPQRACRISRSSTSALADEIDGGFELCRALRAMSATLPIIFLTARDSDFDTVSGLAYGRRRLPHQGHQPAAPARAHRGAVPPARRRASARRPPRTSCERGKLVVDLSRMRVTWDDAPVDLTVTELWIVHALARHPGPRQAPRAAHARRAHGGRRHAPSPRTSSASAASSSQSIATSTASKPSTAWGIAGSRHERPTQESARLARTRRSHLPPGETCTTDMSRPAPWNSVVQSLPSPRPLSQRERGAQCARRRGQVPG